MKSPMILILLMCGSLKVVHAQPLQALDLDGDLTTAVVYYDTVLNISWLADANIGLSQTFGHERGPITDYGSEIDDSGAMLLDAIEFFYPTVRLVAMFSGGMTASVLDGQAGVCLLPRRLAILLVVSKRLVIRCTAMETTAVHLRSGIGTNGFQIPMDCLSHHRSKTWTMHRAGLVLSDRLIDINSASAGRTNLLTYCGAGRCEPAYVWPVHDGMVGTPVMSDKTCIDTDPAGDGGGGDGATSCQVAICIDYDDDVWGWDGYHSRKIETGGERFGFSWIRNGIEGQVLPCSNTASMLVMWQGKTGPSNVYSLEFPGALYHITAVGDQRDDIYENDSDRKSFLSLFENVCADHNWVRHAAIHHPWAANKPGLEGFVMIYTPLSKDELDVVFELVKESYGFITGNEITNVE